MNNIVLSGNIVKDGDRVQVGNTPKVSTRIAVRKERPNANGEYESMFIGIQLWGKVADFFSNYIKKGDSVVLSGKLESYISNNNETVFYVNVSTIELTRKANQQAQQPQQQTQYNQRTNVSSQQPKEYVEKDFPENFDVPIDENDLPF